MHIRCLTDVVPEMVPSIFLLALQKCDFIDSRSTKRRRV